MQEKILDVVHKSAKDLYHAEVIDAMIMREFSDLCVPHE